MPIKKKEKPGKVDPDEVTPLSLRKKSDTALQLMTNTIPCMPAILFPFLFEFIAVKEYTEGLVVLCTTLATVGTRYRAEDDEKHDVDFTVQVNLPSIHSIFGRLIVIAGHPIERARGLWALKCLECMSPNFHPNLPELWDDVIPKLVKYIETNSTNEEAWNQTAWEDLLLKFLSRSLDVINDEDFYLQLGVKLSEQYTLYEGLPKFRNMVSKCLGVVMRKSSNKAFVSEKLSSVFSSVDHSNQIEREGCARALGFVASNHLDQVLEKLMDIIKKDMVPKKTGFLGLTSDKSDADISRIKATLMLCYGFVTFYASPALITSRIEVNILANINPHFNNVKETAVKENLIRCVDLIGKAMNPSHLKQTSFVLHRRGDLLGHMQGYMKSEGKTLTTEIRALSIDACTTLLCLEPKLNTIALYELVDAATTNVLDLPAVPAGDEKAAKLMEQLLASLSNMMGVLIEKDPTSECLQALLKHIGRWRTVPEAHKRGWMARVYNKLMESFHKAVVTTLTTEKKSIRTFVDEFGKLLAELIPRCTDPEFVVRQNALGTIQWFLRIQHITQEHAEEDKHIEAITQLMERTEKVDVEGTAQFAVVNDLSKVLAKKIDAGDLIQFIYTTIEGLLDLEAAASSGACVVLKGIFRVRGGPELTDELSPIFEALHAKMQSLTNDRTRTGVLHAIRTLASHHIQGIVKTLLNFPIPFDKHIVDSWRSILVDENLAKQVLDDLLHILNDGRPYDEVSVNKVTKKNPSIPSLKATCALREFLACPETEALVESNFARIFQATLVRLASAVSIQKVVSGAPTPEKKENKKEVDKTTKPLPVTRPIDDAIACFKEFCIRSKSQAILDKLDANDGAEWKTLENEEEYPKGLTYIAELICMNRSDQVAAIIEQFETVMIRVYDSQRVAAAAVFAEFINRRCGGQLELITRLKNGLMTKVGDKSHVVRMLCIRGLGNIASIPDEQMKKHTTSVLSLLVLGLDGQDDPNDEITLEAMNGLSKVLAKVEEDSVRAILINISLKIRPCFEKSKAGVRAAAIRLFGHLSKFGEGASKASILEQVHGNIISLLLHLNEADAEVRDASKFALRLLGPLLDSELVNNMFQKFLKEGSNLHYGEFVNDLSKYLIKDFPDKINMYTMNSVGFFKSEWVEIKSNAALFTGFLLTSLPVEKRRAITKDHICGELIRLLKDPSKIVREKSAEAISMLFEY